MIKMIFNSIAENSNKIDATINYINKLNKRNCMLFALILVNGYAITKAVKNNEARIIKLENEIKEMKSKGE